MRKLLYLKDVFHEVQTAGSQKSRSCSKTLRRRILRAAEIHGAGEDAHELGLGSVTLGGRRSLMLVSESRARMRRLASEGAMNPVVVSKVSVPALRSKQSSAPFAVVTVGGLRIEVLSHNLIGPFF